MAETTVQEEKTDFPSRRLTRRPRRSPARIIVPIVLVVFAVGGYFLWRYFGSYESTDDAQIDGHLNAISARISGQVNEVLVEDEQLVKKGDVLAKVDPRDYEVAVAKAEADLADAEAALEGSRTDIPVTSTNTESTLKSARSLHADAGAGLTGAERQLNAARARLETARAQVNEAEANYKKAADDVERYKLLVAKDEISAQQYDRQFKRLPRRRRRWLPGRPPWPKRSRISRWRKRPFSRPRRRSARRTPPFKRP